GVGLRLMKTLAPLTTDLTAAVPRRPFVVAKPVDDATFALYRQLYEYDAIPLDAKVEEVEEMKEWRKERVSYTTAYGERMTAYMFLPRNVSPPYQTIVYFPGSD